MTDRKENNMDCSVGSQQDSIKTPPAKELKLGLEAILQHNFQQTERHTWKEMMENIKEMRVRKSITL